MTSDGQAQPAVKSVILFSLNNMPCCRLGLLATSDPCSIPCLFLGPPALVMFIVVIDINQAPLWCLGSISGQAGVRHCWQLVAVTSPMHCPCPVLVHSCHVQTHSHHKCSVTERSVTCSCQNQGCAHQRVLKSDDFTIPAAPTAGLAWH